MKMDKELLAYETPQIEVVEVMVEKGFASSPLENPELGEEEDM